LKFISWRGQGKTINTEFAAAELLNLELLVDRPRDRRLFSSITAGGDLGGLRGELIC
jgi:hypothetical protein